MKISTAAAVKVAVAAAAAALAAAAACRLSAILMLWVSHYSPPRSYSLPYFFSSSVLMGFPAPRGHFALENCTPFIKRTS